MTDTIFLGERLTGDGIKPDPTKIMAVLDIGDPSNKEELQSILGLINFFSKFVPNLAAKTRHMRTLLTRGSVWSWDANQEAELNHVLMKLPPQNSIKTSDFVNMVLEMWHDAMPSKNAISGFECTGIHPVDHSKYQLERLDKRLLNKYDVWVKTGKPVDTSDDLTEADTPIIPLPELPEQPPPPEKIEFTIQEPNTSKQDQSFPAPSLHIDIPPILHPPPPGYKWQYHLCLSQLIPSLSKHANHLSSASWM